MRMIAGACDLRGRFVQAREHLHHDDILHMAQHASPQQTQDGVNSDQSEHKQGYADQCPDTPARNCHVEQQQQIERNRHRKQGNHKGRDRYSCNRRANFPRGTARLVAGEWQDHECGTRPVDSLFGLYRIIANFPLRFSAAIAGRIHTSDLVRGKSFV